MPRSFPRTLTAIAVVLATAGPALAHKLMLTVTVTGDRVRVEAFHDDDTPADGAAVTVRQGDDPPVAEGKTDEKGVWTFARPAPGAYTVRASSVGHIAREGLTVDRDPVAADPTEPASQRDQLTRTPWKNVLIGLGLIAAVCAIVLLVRKRNPAPLSLDS
jgi:hypothetical protein